MDLQSVAKPLEKFRAEMGEHGVGNVKRNGLEFNRGKKA